MAYKRHHYVPAFLLRRFACPDTSRGQRVCRLDRKSGKTVMADPKTDAAENHLYRIVDDDGNVCLEAEAILGRLENDTAPILRKLDEPGVQLSGNERSILGLFVVMQRTRTPFGRQWVKRMDEDLGRAQAKIDLLNGDPCDVVEDRPLTQPQRKELLDLLERGVLRIESPPDRQTALMFLAWLQQAEDLVNRFEWSILRTPEGSEFVLSDNPVAHHDPTLKHPDGGLGFASSGLAFTSLPVDPSFCICIRPRGYPAWGDDVTDAASVDEIDFLTYAWAERALYGRSQKVLTDLRRKVKRHPRRLAKYPRVNPVVAVIDRERDRALIEQAQQRVATLPPNMVPDWA